MTKFQLEVKSMLRPPSPLLLNRYPVTAGTAILAIGATLIWWQGKDLSFLTCNYEVSEGQIYRLITASLLHISVLHLAFNVYWLWLFGTLIESVYGHFWTLAIYFLFASTSSAADYALSLSGVGLSGVGYGLFCMLWILSCHDPRFANSIDKQTIVLWIVWFFLCIATTMTKVMVVGNVAHGAGAVTGLLLGACLVTEAPWRMITACLTAVFALTCLAGASVFRPWINFQADIAAEQAFLGYRDMERNQNETAVRHLLQAVEINSRWSDAWYNLGCGYCRLNEYQKALSAFDHAVELKPTNAGFKEARESCLIYLDRISGLK